jgi:hypothetical protein
VPPPHWKAVFSVHPDPVKLANHHTFAGSQVIAIVRPLIAAHCAQAPNVT